MLGVSLRHVDNLIQQGLPSFTLGRRRLFDVEQVRVYLLQQHQEVV